MIKQAIDYVLSQVDDPALSHPNLDKKIKDKVNSSKQLVRNFKKIGDLYTYLKGFENVPKPGESEVYDNLKALNLLTYEDILPIFAMKFKNLIHDNTVLSDFIIGNKYTSWDISIFAKKYNNLPGIFLIGEEPNYHAIFIKATFADGKYANKWIIENELIKYFMYSLKGNYDISYKSNAAIINSINTNTPIYLFTKEDTVLTLNGIYEYKKYEEDLNDKSKWFILMKIDSLNTNQVMTISEYDNEISRQVNRLKKSSKKEREDRLKNAPKKPDTVTVTTTAFKRNPYVIYEVLERANGVCEYCHNPAPFLRAKDGTPFLEVHHVVALADGGEDTVENAVGICPNCHRRAHHGVKKVAAALLMKDNKILIAQRKSTDKLAGKWEFPGGKQEIGESLEECLKREMNEEFGIEIEVGDFFGESTYHYDAGSIVLYVFWCTWTSGDMIPVDHDDIKWVTIDEMDNYDFAPADIPFIEKLRSSNNESL